VLRIVFFKNLAKENNSPIGKNLPNPVMGPMMGFKKNIFAKNCKKLQKIAFFCSN
jgi:hypothetical protein